MDKPEVVIEGAEEKRRVRLAKPCCRHLVQHASTETAGGHLCVPRLAGQLMACVPAKEFGYLLKGHKWQTGSLWVVFTDMLSLASEVLCKNLGSILNSRALGFCLS